jgi:hypothetical protein
MARITLLRAQPKGRFVQPVQGTRFEIISLVNLRAGNFDFSFTNSSLLMVFVFFFGLVLYKGIVVDGNGSRVPSR